MTERSFSDSLEILATQNAAALANELFRESFGADFPVPRLDAGLSIPTPPECWHQYVASYTWEDGREETVGFCNWIRYGDVYLEGGMCVQKTFYRRMPRDHYLECKQSGGIAQMMMEAASQRLNDCAAWFGYCGDAKALAVDLRAGFVQTRHKHLLVKWFKALPTNEAQALVDSMGAIGPF